MGIILESYQNVIHRQIIFKNQTHFSFTSDNHGRWEWCIEFQVCSSLLKYHHTFDSYFPEEDKPGYYISRGFETIIQDMILDESAQFIKTRDVSNYDEDRKEFEEKRLKKK